jgi:hypothetical protein
MRQEERIDYWLHQRCDDLEYKERGSKEVSTDKEPERDDGG